MGLEFVRLRPVISLSRREPSSKNEMRMGAGRGAKPARSPSEADLKFVHVITISAFSDPDLAEGVNYKL